MFSTKKPKFKLDLSINDLSNIPHTTGYCYIEALIHDGHQGGLRAAISLLKPVSKTNSGSGSVNETSVKKEKTSTSSSSGISGDLGSPSTSGNLHVRTSRRKIHNFKCVFNFKLSCNLRFPFKKRDNMIGNKYLLLKVYFVGEKSTKDHPDNHPSEMGRVELNLSEYLNFDEAVSAKYLLQDSKINSILNLTTSLHELPSDFDFHTQLHIEDSTHGHAPTSTHLTISKTGDQSAKNFKVPQFQRKTVFGGLEGVISTPTSSGNSKLVLLAPSSEDDNLIQAQKTLKKHPNSDTTGTLNIGGTYENVVVDPIVSNLYKKVLESTWDPELHAMLTISPEKIINDIFEPNREKARLSLENDYKTYQEISNDLEGEKEANGLINENRFRDNLKSWSVSWA